MNGNEKPQFKQLDDATERTFRVLDAIFSIADDGRTGERNKTLERGSGGNEESV